MPNSIDSSVRVDAPARVDSSAGGSGIGRALRVLGEQVSVLPIDTKAAQPEPPDCPAGGSASWKHGGMADWLSR